MLQSRRTVTRPMKTTYNLSDEDEFSSPRSLSPEKQPLPHKNIRNNQDSFQRAAAVASNEINEHNNSIRANMKNEENLVSSPSEIRIASAETAVKEIVDDKLEAQRMIVTYGIEPVKVLHMVERWTQMLLGEFKSSYHGFKHVLKEKWEKQELNVNSNLYNHERMLYYHVQNLERSKQDYLSKKYFEDLKTVSTKIDPITNMNELKSKIQDVTEKFLQIIESIEFIEQYHGNTNGSSFETIKNVLQRLQILNKKTSHTICIIGLEKCGKSTFINALLGFKLLPAESERCTQIRTVLKPTLEEEPLLVASVEFYNDHEFQVLFEKMVKKSDEEEEQYKTRKNQVQQKRLQFMTSFPHRNEKLMVSSSNNPDSERDEIIKKLHVYIIDELCVNIIKEIAIYTDKLPGKNYELLDVPGFDSPIKEHRDAGLQSIKSADAFLFLTDGNRPSLTRDQIRLLKEIQDGKQHYEAMKRAFGIITKLDHCHTSNEFGECHDKAKQELITKGFKENHIFAVCSITNLLDKNTDDYRTITRKIQYFNNLQDGFQRSKEALNQFIELELPKTHLSQLIDLGSTKLSYYVDEGLSNAKKLLPSTVTFTDQGSFDDYIRQENSKKWDKIYHDDLFQPTFEKANIWQKTVLVQERDKFLNEIKTKFCESFTAKTKKFNDHPVDIQSKIMKRYDYTILHSTSQPIDDESRRELSFELEEVIKTISILVRHLYDEYISKLEKILSEISREENDNLYGTQLVSYDICRYEIHAVILLLLIAPTVICHLCESNNQENGSVTQTIANWAPTLKKGVEFVLGIYGKTGIQNRITLEVLKLIMNQFK